MYRLSLRGYRSKSSAKFHKLVQPFNREVLDRFFLSNWGTVKTSMIHSYYLKVTYW